jgi:hypothetical protein
MKSRIEFRARGLLGCGISDVLPDTLMREMARDYANMLGEESHRPRHGARGGRGLKRYQSGRPVSLCFVASSSAARAMVERPSMVKLPFRALDSSL